MSKFIEKLQRIWRNEPQPMGFALSRSASEKPRIQLIAQINAADVETITASLSSADAVIVNIAKSDDVGALEKLCQSKDGPPAGGWIKVTNNGALKKLLNLECDFAVFSTSSQLTVTQKEKLGRILEIDASLSEGLLRTCNDLPVDAVLTADKVGESLNISRLMQIQHLLYFINKPILVAISNDLGTPDLQALWDAGVSGVIIEIEDEKSAEKLVELRKTLEKLTPSTSRKKARTSAILPRLQAETPPPEEGEEEEDE